MLEETPTSSAEILLVDDHPIFRHGLSKLIEQEPGLTVCGEAATVAEALDVLSQSRPRLVIVDLSLSSTPGLELVKDIHVRYPDVAILVLSMHDEVLWAERALRAGAHGYVMKQERPRTLVAAIRQVLLGDTWLSPQMTTRLVNKLTGRRTEAGSKSEEALGDRELQVLQLLGEGRSTRQIAEALNVSVKTIEAHREHIKRKLLLENSASLIRYAVLRFSSSS